MSDNLYRFPAFALINLTGAPLSVGNVLAIFETGLVVSPLGPDNDPAYPLPGFYPWEAVAAVAHEPKELDPWLMTFEAIRLEDGHTDLDAQQQALKPRKPRTRPTTPPPSN